MLVVLECSLFLSVAQSDDPFVTSKRGFSLVDLIKYCFSQQLITNSTRLAPKSQSVLVCWLQHVFDFEHGMACSYLNYIWQNQSEISGFTNFTADLSRFL